MTGKRVVYTDNILDHPVYSDIGLGFGKGIGNDACRGKVRVHKLEPC